MTRAEKIRRIVFLLAPCILMLSVILSVGAAYGRYITSLKGENSVAVSPKDEAYVSRSDWTGVDGRKSMSIEITNENGNEVIKNDILTRIRLFTPIEEGNPTAKLNVNGNIYIGTAYTLSEKTPMYNEYGEGRVYKFLDAKGEERTFLLEGNEATYYSVTVIIEGIGSTDGVKVDVDMVQSK